jgi:hypothetical protein
MAGYAYDVFISHSAADRPWVSDWLVPRLEAAGLCVAVGYRDFPPGASLLDIIPQVVGASRHAIIVVTPSWTADEWAAYEASVTRTFDPTARRRKLIPALLKPCRTPECHLPPALVDLVSADFTDPALWEAELARLSRTLRGITPPPRGGDGPAVSRRRWLGWWLHYHRRRLLGGVAASAMLVLLLSALAGWPTFPGWRALGDPIPQAYRLYRAGDVLLVSTYTDDTDCVAVGRALWRSTDDGEHWRPVAVPLRAAVDDRTCIPSAIVDFSHATARPQVIYAATSNTGLLRSGDGGATWVRVGEGGVPDALSRVAVTDSGLLLTSGAQGGLFRSRDDGSRWERLDGPGICAGQPDGSLPVGFRAGALLAAEDTVYAGDAVGETAIGTYPGKTAGLYASRDGGSCWERIDDAEGRFVYVALAPTESNGDLMVLTRDTRATADDYPYQLWLVVPWQGRSRLLWAYCHTATSLAASAGWQVAGWTGVVSTGRTDVAVPAVSAACAGPASLIAAGAVGGERLPSVRRCALPPGCFADLAPGKTAGEILLLMGDRVYRPGRVAWPQALWP